MLLSLRSLLNRNYLAMKKAPSPAPYRFGRDFSNWPTAEPSSWTRSGICPWKFSPSCSGPSRRGSWSGSAALTLVLPGQGSAALPDPEDGRGRAQRGRHLVEGRQGRADDEQRRRTDLDRARPGRARHHRPPRLSCARHRGGLADLREDPVTRSRGHDVQSLGHRGQGICPCHDQWRRDAANAGSQ